MPKKQPDLRVRRTHKMLREAFIELVIAEGFDAITVQKLADEAMINRATFYRHYEDKFDLAEKIYASLTAEYSASIEAVKFDNPTDASKTLFEHIAQNADFYQSMLATMPRFQGWVRQNIEDELEKLFLQMGLDESALDLPLGAVLSYLANAQLGLVQWWLESGQQIPAELMAQHMMQLHIFGGIQSLKLPLN